MMTTNIVEIHLTPDQAALLLKLLSEQRAPRPAERTAVAALIAALEREEISTIIDSEDIRWTRLLRDQHEWLLRQAEERQDDDPVWKSLLVPLLRAKRPV